MNIERDDLSRLTADVWETTLGLPLHAERDAAGADEPGAGTWTAYVQISGAYDGGVSLNCSDDLARAAASRMFDTEDSQVRVDQVQDALAELANIIAGNVKSLLAQPSQLHLPHVSEGGRHALADLPPARRVESHLWNNRQAVCVSVGPVA